MTAIFFFLNRWNYIHIDHLLREILYCHPRDIPVFVFQTLSVSRSRFLSQFPTTLKISCDSKSNKVNVRLQKLLVIAQGKHDVDGTLRQDTEKALKSLYRIYILKYFTDIHRDYVWMTRPLDFGRSTTLCPPDAINTLSFLNTLKSAGNSSVIYPAIYPIEQKVIARTQRFYSDILGWQNSGTDQLVIFHYVR